MNKIILTGTLLAACGLGAICSNAVAQNAPANATATTTSNPATQQTTADNAGDVALGVKQVPAPGSRNCIRDTGSNIKRHDQACLPLNGSSYSHDELMQTGEPDLGRALRQLDPTISGGGG